MAVPQVTLTFFGHAAFSLQHGDTTLLFDPYLSKNPLATVQASDVWANYILISHAHFDHVGDSVAIAARTGATVITTAEVGNLLTEKGVATVHRMHIGGKQKFDFGYVRVTPAFHGAGVPGGHAAGFIVNFYGITVYFAGDTSIFGDMALLGRLESIDYALLPIGDNFTMGPDDACEAVGLLQPRQVIPMHYNTFEVIEQSPEEFKQKVEQRYAIPVHILQPGQGMVLDRVI